MLFTSGTNVLRPRNCFTFCWRLRTLVCGTFDASELGPVIKSLFVVLQFSLLFFPCRTSYSPRWTCLPISLFKHFLWLFTSLLTFSCNFIGTGYSPVDFRPWPPIDCWSTSCHHFRAAVYHQAVKLFSKNFQKSVVCHFAAINVVVYSSLLATGIFLDVQASSYPEAMKSRLLSSFFFSFYVNCKSILISDLLTVLLFSSIYTASLSFVVVVFGGVYAGLVIIRLRKYPFASVSIRVTMKKVPWSPWVATSCCLLLIH